MEIVYQLILIYFVLNVNSIHVTGIKNKEINTNFIQSANLFNNVLNYNH